MGGGLRQTFVNVGTTPKRSEVQLQRGFLRLLLRGVL
jgi:hypothetical protein